MTTFTVGNISDSSQLSSKESITKYVDNQFRKFSKGVNTSADDWRRFRHEVYQLNKKCSEFDQTKYKEVQETYHDRLFCGDDISRCSADSSIFMPQLPTHTHRILKPNSGTHHQNKITANTITGKVPIRFGGV
jgi:hypothetical protein